LTVGGQTKAAEKSRKEEIEAEKKRIREVRTTYLPSMMFLLQLIL